MAKLDPRKEDEALVTSPPTLYILGATYGPADVTEVVAANVDQLQQLLSITANNTTFGDPWPGNGKCLVVVYRYEQQKQQTAVVKENSTLNIGYEQQPDAESPTDPSHLYILGAAYGPAIVTDKVANLATNTTLSIKAESDIFPADPWPDVEKTLTVVYQYGRGSVKLKSCKEHDLIQIALKAEVDPDLVPINGLLDDNDVVNFAACNNFYVACDSQRRLVATGEVPSQGGKIRVVKVKDSIALQVDDGKDNKYIEVHNNDKCLYATADDKQKAALFTFSIGINGSLYIASSGYYCTLMPDNKSISLNAPRYTQLVSAFDIGIDKVDAEQWLMHHDILMQKELTPCDVAWATFVWQLTAGFFLALGLGPYLISNQAQPGVYNLLRASGVWPTIERFVRSNRYTISTAAALGIVKLLYQEGLLWTVFKFIMSTAGWWGAGWALGQIIKFVLLPELEAAELLASFAIWSAQLTQSAIAVNNSCR